MQGGEPDAGPVRRSVEPIQTTIGDYFEVEFNKVVAGQVAPDRRRRFIHVKH